MMQNNKLNKKAFISNDFIDSQYYWLLPIVVSYCHKLKYKQIVFEDFNSIINDKNFIKIFKECNIEFTILNKKKIISKLKKIFIYAVSFIISIFQFIFFDNKKILTNKSWSKTQYLHAVSDLSRNLSSDRQIKPSFFNIFKSFLICNKRFIEIYLIAKKNYSVCFLGHTVYSSRISLLIFRKYNSLIYAQANWNIYSLDKNHDRSWSMPESKLRNKLLSVININNVHQYWEERLKGNSNYEDANVSINLNSNNNYTSDNYILLHIFRDSPFNVLDQDRIFIDYYEWVIETLKILNNTDEKWTLRTHPNCKRWGENSHTILKLIMSKLQKENYSLNNINIELDQISNFKLFSKAKKIVTFSGTSHLEAACFGIKPIVISKCTLTDFDNLYLKPKNLEEYKNFLLTKNNSITLSLGEEEINLSKKLIYIRENILSFKNELNSFNLYKGDNEKLRKKEFEIIKKNILLKIKYFNQLGEWLSEGNSQTISQKYLNKIF